MYRLRWISLLCALSVTLVGCQPADDAGDGNTTTAASNSSATETVEVATILCGQCGEEKGSATCCAQTAETCECGMHKGSALCCVELPADAAGKDICSQCGHVAEAGHTCDGDCEKCAECGLHAGSPACCKLKG